MTQTVRPTTPNELTADSRLRLKQLESEIAQAQEEHEETIRETTRDFHLQLGRLLDEIRRDKLWRATHPTWDAYCNQRWGWTRQWCNRLVKAATAEENGGLDGIEGLSDGKSLSIDELARPRGQPLNYRKLDAALGRMENRLRGLRDESEELLPLLRERERNDLLDRVEALLRQAGEFQAMFVGMEEAA